MQRIRIVAGLVMGLVGLAISYFGPLIIFYAAYSDLTQPDLDGVDGVSRRMAAIHSVGNSSAVLNFGGLGISVIGFLYAFVQWAIAFIGPPDTAMTTAPRV